MSILIRGAKMPKTCNECNISFCTCWNEIKVLDGENRNTELENWFKSGIRSIARHPDCPLVDIPEHGDLIDRNELYRRMGILNSDCYNCPHGKHGMCKMTDDFSDWCDNLDECHAIIPADEKGPSEWKCSSIEEYMCSLVHEEENE